MFLIYVCCLIHLSGGHLTLSLMCLISFLPSLRLHDASIIHGDLTTSNVILVAAASTSTDLSSAVRNSSSSCSLCDSDAGEKGRKGSHSLLASS